MVTSSNLVWVHYVARGRVVFSKLNKPCKYILLSLEISKKGFKCIIRNSNNNDFYFKNGTQFIEDWLQRIVKCMSSILEGGHNRLDVIKLNFSRLM